MSSNGTATKDDGTWQTEAEIPEQERYARYMTSREWAVRKRPIKERSGGICERCKINPSSAVHHISYTRKYREESEDLQDLCQACHKFLHAKSDEDPLAPKELARTVIEKAVLVGIFRTRETICLFFYDPDARTEDWNPECIYTRRTSNEHEIISQLRGKETTQDAVSQLCRGFSLRGWLGECYSLKLAAAPDGSPRIVESFLRLHRSVFVLPLEDRIEVVCSTQQFFCIDAG